MISIRRVRLADLDIDQINNLRAQQTRGSPPKLIDETIMKDVFANPHFHLYVAIEERCYVGMAAVYFQRIFSGWIGEVHDVVVDESVRGKGIGESLTRQLMNAALDFCFERSVTMKLSLTCRPSREAANALYQKLGFVLIARSAGPKCTNLYEITVAPDGFKGR